MTTNEPCRKCGGEMLAGIAIAPTVVTGVPDFPGNTAESRGQTLSYGGPGRLVDCSKCAACGWSVTSAAAQEKPAAPSEPRTDWTITAPDGRQWTGPSAFRVASTAHKETMTPEQRDTLLRTLRLEQEEADRQMTADHEHLNCPACGGSGHVEDARGGWIAVADRLPDQDAHVLAAFEMDGPGDWRIKVGIYEPDTQSAYEGWRIFGGGWVPTHWRPLPAAPSEGSQG